MKTALRLTFLACLALNFTGYGKRVPVPGETIVAAYVDLEKAYENGKSLVYTFIDAVPSGERRKVKEEYDKIFTGIDKARDVLNPEWALITFGGTIKAITLNRPGENVAVVLKVRTDENAVKKWLEEDLSAREVKTRTRNGNVLFEIFGKERLALIDNSYLVIAFSKDALEDMFDVYAGSAKTLAAFDDLAEISGDTICRISTAPVSTLLNRFELSRYIERFGEASKDMELAEMILNMGAISLDIDAGKNVGLRLRVKCNSSSDAQYLEHLAHSVAFLARIGYDSCAFLADNPELVAGGMPSRDRKFFADAKDFFVALARGIKADRRDNTVELSTALEAETVTKASVVVGCYLNYLKDARIETARMLIANVNLAVKSYYLKHGKYPDSLEALTQAPDGEEPLLLGDCVDPWGNELKYEKRGKMLPCITSAGPDGEFDTEDDISNLDKSKVEIEKAH